MDLLRVIVVDDEPIARETIRSLLAVHPGIEVVAECGNGSAALATITELEPDAVFLDVQMPGMNGFEVIERLAPDGLPLIVFITAYDRYAVRAFDVHAVDYLLKPFDDERFHAAVERLREKVRLDQQQDVAQRLLEMLDARREGVQPRPYLARIAVRSGPRVAFVPVDEIDWIEAENYYLRIHYGAKSHLLREGMAALEKRLDPSKFVRIHRSTIVNVDRVREIHPEKADYLVVLADGTKVRMARSRRESLQRLFTR